MENKKQFAPSFLLNLTKSGSGSRALVNAKLFDILQRVKLGDSLFLQELTEEQVSAIKGKSQFESSPTHRVTILPGDAKPAQQQRSAPRARPARQASASSNDDI